MGIKILTVGNSFADNATVYLERMAAAGGVEDFVLGKANLGGCSLEKHWNLVRQCELLPDARPYNLQITGRETAPATLRQALAAMDWDFVTLQQVSNLSWRIETYHPYLTNLYRLVRELAPGACPVIHQTWAYRVDAPLLREWGVDQQTMYSMLNAAYHQISAELGRRVLPCGDAFQMARTSLNFVPDTSFDYENPKPLELPRQDKSLIAGYHWATGNTPSGNPELRMDERHGNAKGCYLANAVWYEMFTGLPVAANAFRPEGVGEDEIRILQDAAHTAVAAVGGPLDAAS